VNTLIKHRDDHAVEAVLARIGTMPHAANKFAEYLRLFADRPEIEAAVMGAVRDPERNLFEWQEAWLLRVFLTSERLTDASLAWLRNRAQDKSISWIIRTTAILLLDKFGDIADIQALANDFSPIEEPPTQRARLKACSRLSANARSLLFDRAKNVSEELAATVSYLG
jgi:hypothetical protein